MTTRGDDVQAAPIPFEEIARLPPPGTAEPVGFCFGASDRVLAYRHAPDGGLERRLFALRVDDLAAGAVEVPVGGTPASEDTLSLEEQLRRERAREVGVGITAATWAERADALLVPLPDGLHVLRGLAESPGAPAEDLVLAGQGGDVVAPSLSPDGTKIAFVRGGELHVVEARSGAAPTRLTHTAEEGLRNGVAELMAEEEMGRSSGCWWSPDSASLAYCEVDERHIPVYRIVHQGSDDVGPGAQEDHRYPFAGKDNATVYLGVVPATAGGDTTWMQLPGPDVYLARVHWLRSGRLVAEVESRDQTQLDLWSFDVTTGVGTLVHSERAEPYVNLHDDFRELTSGEFLWSSERTGFRHLELRSATGALVRVLTSGAWQVDALEGVDEKAGLAFFTATKDGATERHLYAVPIAGGDVRRLTEEAGSHGVTLSLDGTLFVDRHGALGSPPTVRLRTCGGRAEPGAGTVLATLHDERDPRIDALGLTPPELVTLPGADGTELFGLYYRPSVPPGSTGVAPPLAVRVYGGPHAQLVVNDWDPTVDMRAQALRRLGVAVLVVDNRGSARRGLRFEAALHRRMGQVEVDDQVAAVRWAVARGLGDEARVGIYGWSYGGYMTLRCLGLAPGTFRVGVAGAPVTDWDGYDTHYTERYMGTPQSNPDGYRSSSTFGCVDEIRGDLLLVHGLIDENVHFRHTARLVDRLIAAGREHRLLCFPSERHLPRRAEDRAYLEEQVIGFLVARLGADRDPDVCHDDAARE